MIMKQNRKKVVFMDLDLTIRKSKTGKFISSVQDIEIIEEVKNAAQILKNEGYEFFGITNQGGVAHGFKTIEDVKRENSQTNRLCDFLFSQIHYSPFEKEGNTFPYDTQSTLRKPHYGMISVIEYNLMAQGDFIDWKNSFLVGDSDEDKGCADGVGVRFFKPEEFVDYVSTKTTFNQQ